MARIQQHAAELKEEWRKLAHQWRSSSEQWRDKAQTDFLRNHWQPLEREVRLTDRAVDNVIEAIERAQRALNR